METAGWGFPAPLLSRIKQSQRRHETRSGCGASSAYCPPSPSPMFFLGEGLLLSRLDSDLFKLLPPEMTFLPLQQQGHSQKEGGAKAFCSDSCLPGCFSCNLNFGSRQRVSSAASSVLQVAQQVLSPLLMHVHSVGNCFAAPQVSTIHSA